MTDLMVVVDTSDLILALGIKFWAGIIEKQNIQDLEQCHQTINIIQDFLIPDSQEIQDHEEEKSNDEDQNMPETKDGDDDDDRDQVKKTVGEDLTEVTDETTEPLETKIEMSAGIEEISVEKKENVEKDNVEADVFKKKKIIKRTLVYCDYCVVSAPSVKRLSEHISDEHGEKMTEFEVKYRRYLCLYCPASYYSDSSRSSHMRTAHDGEKTQPCQFCEKNFHTEVQLRKHEAVHAGSIRCETCGRECVGRRRYRKHLERHKTGICAVCGKTFPKPSLRRHQQTHSKASFQCENCGLEVVGSRSYQTHLRSHQSKLGEDQKTEYKCGVCGLVLGTEYLRKKHRYKAHTHNYEKFFCPVCGKKFYYSSQLKRHVVSHGESKDIGCDQCQKKFKSLLNLKRHQQVHQPDSVKRYKCSYSADCTRAFSNSESLHSHMNSHLGLKPYKCHLCDTKFQNTSNRLAHLRNVHK